MNRAERRKRAFDHMVKRIKQRSSWIYMCDERSSWAVRHMLWKKRPKTTEEALEHAPYMAAYKKTVSFYKDSWKERTRKYRNKEKARVRREIKEAMLDY